MSNEIRDLHMQHTVHILLALGDTITKVFPSDEKEQAIFLKSYYDFIKYGLTK